MKKVVHPFRKSDDPVRGTSVAILHSCDGVIDTDVTDVCKKQLNTYCKKYSEMSYEFSK